MSARVNVLARLVPYQLIDHTSPTLTKMQTNPPQPHARAKNTTVRCSHVPEVRGVGRDTKTKATTTGVVGGTR